MKRITVLLLCVMTTIIGHASNRLTLSTAQGHPGDTVTLTLSLTNTDNITAIKLQPRCSMTHCASTPTP